MVSGMAEGTGGAGVKVEEAADFYGPRLGDAVAILGDFLSTAGDVLAWLGGRFYSLPGEVLVPLVVALVVIFKPAWALVANREAIAQRRQATFINQAGDRKAAVQTARTMQAAGLLKQVAILFVLLVALLTVAGVSVGSG